MSNKRSVPSFSSSDEEAQFWDEHDSADYIDWSKAERAVFPNLKNSTVSISLRLPTWLLERIRELADRNDVPYQSLMKVYLRERVEKEIKDERSYKLTARRGFPSSTSKVTPLGKLLDAEIESRKQSNATNNDKENLRW